MKTPEIISTGQNYTAINIGKLDDLTEYTMIHPKLKTEIHGRVFTGETLAATGAEISFQVVPPNTTLPFLHQHRNHEEIYIFLRGKGQFQVDGVSFDVTEGTMIRIAPDGKRTYRNNSSAPMIYMCIQCREKALTGYMVSDGFRSKEEVLWPE